MLLHVYTDEAFTNYGFILRYAGGIRFKGKVYVDYRIKRHTPLPVLYISPPPTLLNFLRIVA